jgi:hypothetical protein
VADRGQTRNQGFVGTLADELLAKRDDDRFGPVVYQSLLSTCAIGRMTRSTIARS